VPWGRDKTLFGNLPQDRAGFLEGMFFSRIIEIRDLVFVIGAVDEFDFGMGFPEGEGP
jgi:hypothetical protein